MTSRRVILIRHGETSYHKGNRYLGRLDEPLNATGKAQATAIARWAASAGVAGIWSSPLKRAKTTADVIADACGLRLTVDARLIELDFGAAEGLTVEEMRRRFPEERGAFERDPYRFPLPGAENPVDAVDRAKAAYSDALASLPAAGTLLVVSHSTLIRLLACTLVGDYPGLYRTTFPTLDPGHSIELAVSSRTTRIVAVNGSYDELN